MHEVRALLGEISRQRAYQVTSRDDFPKPVAELAAGKVWLRDDVNEWIRLNRSVVD